MKPLLASLALLLSTSTPALADEPSPRYYAEVGAGRGGLSRNPGGDFAGEDDETIEVVTRVGRTSSPGSKLALELSLGYSHFTSLNPDEAGAGGTFDARGERQRLVGGVRRELGGQWLRGFVRAAIGMERIEFGVSYGTGTGVVRDTNSDRGLAIELGGGAMAVRGRYHVALELGVGVEIHSAESVGGGGDATYVMTYFGVDSRWLVVGGVAF